MRKPSSGLYKWWDCNRTCFRLTCSDWFRFHLKAGWGGYPLVGTPDHIASELSKLSEIGFDGILLSWVDYLAGLECWNSDVMPLLEQAGLRQRRWKSEAA